MSTQVDIAPSWRPILQDEFNQPYFGELAAFVRKRYQEARVYPAGREIFKAFSLCPFEKLSVVILGQDPYHGQGQAHGLSFSVPMGVRMPPSLVNIFKERQSDLGKPFPSTGNLASWAKQGVLLLNATLTVEASKPGSHQKKGWERFTDAVIKHIATKKEGVVFILWGAYAQQKMAFINPQKHLIIKSAHPSPYSADRGFFGSNPFSRTNAYLSRHSKPPIDW